MEDGWKKKIARKLHSFKRQAIKKGKPTFPVLLLGATKSREAMQEQVGSEACLILYLLMLKCPKDWLLVLPSTGEKNAVCLACQFALHIVLVNALG